MGIVDVEVSESIQANEGLIFQSHAPGNNSTNDLPRGVRFFLHRIGNRATYTFGGVHRDTEYDICIPMSLSTTKLFELKLDAESKTWRILATANTVITVNGEQCQKSQSKSKKGKQTELPSVLYLDVS